MAKEYKDEYHLYFNQNSVRLCKLKFSKKKYLSEYLVVRASTYS